MVLLHLQEALIYGGFLLLLTRLEEPFSGTVPRPPPSSSSSSPEGLFRASKGVEARATLLLPDSEQVGRLLFLSLPTLREWVLQRGLGSRLVLASSLPAFLIFLCTSSQVGPSILYARASLTSVV